jgi:hypothetical protein
MKTNVCELAMLVQVILLYGEVELRVERFELNREQLSLLLFERDLMPDCLCLRLIEVIDQLDFAVLEVWLAIDRIWEINVVLVPNAAILHVSAHVALHKAPRFKDLTVRYLRAEVSHLTALDLTASLGRCLNLTSFLIRRLYYYFIWRRLRNIISCRCGRLDTEALA